jgi:hypothetical protein
MNRPNRSSGDLPSHLVETVGANVMHFAVVVDGDGQLVHVLCTANHGAIKQIKSTLRQSKGTFVQRIRQFAVRIQNEPSSLPFLQVQSNKKTKFAIKIQFMIMPRLVLRSSQNLLTVAYPRPIDWGVNFAVWSQKQISAFVHLTSRLHCNHAIETNEN